MGQSAIGTPTQESNIVSDRFRITGAQLLEKVWARADDDLGRRLRRLRCECRSVRTIGNKARNISGQDAVRASGGATMPSSLR
jgi:hypothetical protein